MSWDKYFKAHQTLKFPVLSKSEGREFLREAKKLEQFDDCTRQLCRDSKQLSDAEYGVLRAEQKLASDLFQSSQIKADDRMSQCIIDWNESVKQHEESVSLLATNMQKVVVEPLKRLGTIFPNIQTLLKKRDQLLMDYNKWYLKVDKYQKKERTGPNIVKLDTYKKSMESAKEEFDRHNDMLLEEMPKLYNSRVEYMSPSLKALVNLQLMHYEQCNKYYTELSHCLHEELEQNMADNQLDRFNELKALSIVTSD